MILHFIYSFIEARTVRQYLTESIEVLIGGGEGVILVKGADFGGALVSCGYWPHLSLLGGAAGSLLLLLCQLPVVVRSHAQTGNNRHVNNFLDKIIDKWAHRRQKENDKHRSTEEVNKQWFKWRHTHEDSYSMACFQGRTLSETVHQHLCCIYIPDMSSYILYCVNYWCDFFYI